MTAILCTLTWAFVFAVSTAAMGVIRHRIDEETLPAWLRGQRGEQVAFVAGCLTVASAISVIVWSSLSLRWYAVILVWFVGCLAHIPIGRQLTPAVLIMTGPLVMVGLNVILWMNF